MPDAASEQWLARIEVVQGFIQAQDWDRALSAIDEAVRDAPPTGVGAHLSALRVQVKQNQLQSLYVEALIVLDSERVALGTPITGQIILVNLSKKQLVIPAQVRGNQTTIQLNLSYREFDNQGALFTERRQHPVRIGKDIVLEPGERHSEAIVLDSLQFGPHRVNYRRYELEARMYPSQILIGDEPFPGNLLFEPARCEVFPRNFEHLIERPLARLDEAVRKNSPTHVPLAAALVALTDKEKAIGKLVSFLRQDWGKDPDGPTRVACCVGLRILTGEELAAQPDLWLEWWEKRGR
ncbi:MAG: hypothetical protein CMJ83_08165 [Planctomycetes bacterium]|nr:hypothetical protein [Planctomycetota bacterium]